VSVLLGNGDGTFQAAAVSYQVGSHPISVAVADFDADGKQDLVVSNGASNDVSVLLGNGDGTFRPAVAYAVGSGPGAVVVGDFDGDSIPDIAVENFGTDDVSVLLGKGDGTFQPSVRYSAGVGPGGLVTGDFNGDGVLDLAVANHNSSNVSVLLGKGDGTFRLPIHLAAGNKPAGIARGDFRGNGNANLVVANHYSDDISVFLNRPPAPHFLLQAPHHMLCGARAQIMVVALDSLNNVDNKYTATVRVACSDRRAELSQNELAFGDGVNRDTLEVKFHTPGAHSVVVTDKSNPDRVGAITVIVWPGAATHFRVSAPADVIAGKPFTIIVTAIAEFDNEAFDYEGVAQFRSSDAQAGLPSDCAFVESDQGKRAFTVKLNTVGKQTITVSDKASKSVAGSVTVKVEKDTPE
jgi:hypothetical protein